MARPGPLPYGHVQGDQALRATADVLRKTLRRSDTICRYGGEEFMVVLPETSAESPLNRADQELYASKTGGRNRFSIAD